MNGKEYVLYRPAGVEEQRVLVLHMKKPDFLNNAGKLLSVEMQKTKITCRLTAKRILVQEEGLGQ